MAEFPYTPSPKNVTDFFSKMQSIGVPKTKVTRDSIKAYGFKSSNDRYLIGVLKSLGFLDADGLPTGRWQDYRSRAKSGLAVASGIKEVYAGLFETYEDAYARDDETLRDYFKANTQAADAVVEYMLKTFKNLCALADFKAVPAVIPVAEPVVSSPLEEEAAPKVKITPNLQLNIEIHIAADTSDDKIEAIFKNMKKYLLSNE